MNMILTVGLVVLSVFIYRAINLTSGGIIRGRLFLCRAVEVDFLDVALPRSGHSGQGRSQKLSGCNLNSEAEIYQRNPGKNVGQQ